MFVAAVLFLVIASLTIAQTNVTVLRQQLASADLGTRLAATTELERLLVSEPQLVRDREVQETVVALLERENGVINKNLEVVLQGGEPLFSEGYSEHYSRVLGITLSVRKALSSEEGPLRTRFLRALVRSTYNPDSAFARQLASEGEHIVSHVLEIVNSDNETARWNGQALIAFLFRLHDEGGLGAPITTSSRQVLRLAARAGLADPKPGVRRHAIDAVVAGRDRSALPLLIQLAESDPDMDLGLGAHSVRARARSAIAELQRPQ